MTRNHSKKILITGGRSMIASKFMAMLPDEVVCPGKDELDISDASAIKAWLESGRFHTVINMAGISSRSAFVMYGINARYPFHLAEACAGLDIRFAMLSSSRVFDGRKNTPYLESDPPNPVDDYGQSKYLGECLVQSLKWNVPYYIFRLPLVLGVRERNQESQIVTRLIEQAKHEKTIKAATDVIHSPIHVSQAVSAIMDCIGSDSPMGVYHLGRGESVSLYDLMVSIIQNMGIRAEVLPVKAAAFEGDSVFPRFQSLRSATLNFASSYHDDLNLFVKESGS